VLKTYELCVAPSDNMKVVLAEEEKALVAEVEFVVWEAPGTDVMSGPSAVYAT